VLVLDANHVPAQDSFLVKKTALEFINRYLGANDVAAVVHAQTTAMDFNQEFTNSRPRLRMAVDRFAGEKLGSRALAVREVAIQSANLGRAGIDPRDAKDPNATERAARANATIDTMEKVSRHMNGLRGRRKAVILISEGLDFNLDDSLGPGVMPASSNDGVPRDPIASNSFNEAYHASGIVERMQSMYESASRSNVAIYTVDPRGVASELDTLINAPGMPDAFPIDIGNVTAGVREELRRQIGTLRFVCRSHRRPRARWHQRLRHRLQEDRRRQQRLLRARLPADAAEDGRQVPQHQRAAEATRPAGAGAARVLRAQGRGSPRRGAGRRSRYRADQQPDGRRGARDADHPDDGKGDRREGASAADPRDRRRAARQGAGV
jgi:VWFA-related protein